MKRFAQSFATLLLILFLIAVTVSCNSSSGTTAEGSTQSPTSMTTENTTQNKPADSVSKPDSTLTTSHTTTTTQPSTTTSEITTTEPEDTLPIPEQGTYIRVTYQINNSEAGSISGSTIQSVRYGLSSSTTVSVTPNLGYKFVGWSDGKTETVRSGDCPRQNTTYVAIFEFDALELPILDLHTNN